MRHALIASLVVSSLATLVGCGSSPTSMPPSCGGAGGAANEARPTENPPAWGPIGLGGDIVSSIALDPKNPAVLAVGLSAGSHDTGAWRSKDRGATWTKMGVELPDRAATLVALVPATGALVANPGAEGLWRSEDQGDTWAQSSVDPGAATSIFCHPTNKTVWAVASQSGVYRSRDAGATFVHTPNTNLPLNQFALGPLYFDGVTLYLGTASSGVWVSTDEGDSWSRAPSANLPVSGPSSEVIGIAGDQGVLFVKTNGGLFRSTDSAASFTKMDVAKPRYAALFVGVSQALVAVDEASGGVGGLFKSADDGLTWSALGPMALPIVAVNVATDDAIYVGTVGQGIWRLGK